MFTQFNSSCLNESFEASWAVHLVPFLHKYVLRRLLGKGCAIFLFVNSSRDKRWPPRYWGPFFAISWTLVRFLFKVCAGGILQLCVVSCIACCDLAFCLPAWMTNFRAGVNQLPATGYEAVLLTHKLLYSCLNKSTALKVHLCLCAWAYWNLKDG